MNKRLSVTSGGCMAERLGTPASGRHARPKAAQSSFPETTLCAFDFCHRIHHTGDMKTKQAFVVSPDDDTFLSGAEIRRIRKRLGLTQAQAGEILGGGPRAFSKYETNTVRPSAATAVLLRLLDENPSLLRDPAARSRRSPFEVTAEDVIRLSADLPNLLRGLLHAEAHTFDLPGAKIHVSGNTSAPDGGEDGRIRWEGGPKATRFLPSRFCQFQVKGGKLTVSAARKEVLSGAGAIKPMVAAALTEGGHYVLLCSHQYPQKDIQARASGIQEVLRQSGLDVPDDRILFQDASQIASWVNVHPAVAAWVLERTRPGLVGPFSTWRNWRDRFEHFRSPWVADERLPIVQERCALAQQRQGVTRLVGLSGIGKSRLVLEALGPENLKLQDLVLYSAESETQVASITKTVQSLALAGVRAIVVVDGCPPKSHRMLAHLVQHKDSSLSLISIDDEVPNRLGSDEQVIDEAPPAVVDSILKAIEPSLYVVDKDRFTRFSSGFPQVALEVVASWERNRQLPATPSDLTNDFVLGRDPQERELELRAAALLASVGHMGIDSTVDNQRRAVADLGRSIDERDLYSCAQRLLARGVGRRRGRYVTIEPRPVALNLAERQWREEWQLDDWDIVLCEHASADLRLAAAKTLALLNTERIAREVASHVLRPGGPFDDPATLLTAQNLRILEKLAQIDPRAVVERVDDTLSRVDDLTDVAGDARRSLVEAANTIAFDPGSFALGANLLLRLGVAENETWANNATGCFASLFPVQLGNTAADGTARLEVIEQCSSTDDPRQRSIVVQALLKATETEYFTRTVGAEERGSLPSLQPWIPGTWREEVNYVKSCVERLLEFALRQDRAAEEARSGLGHSLGGLVRAGLIDTVEKAVDAVRGTFGSWPSAVQGLGAVMAREAQNAPQGIIDRVRVLLERLTPTDFDSRVRELVTAMPWEYPCDEQLDPDEQLSRQNAVVGDLAVELAEHPEVLSRLLPTLSQGEQRKTFEFGEALAQHVASKTDWLDSILIALRSVPANEQNPQLLAGYLRGIASAEPKSVLATKRAISASEGLRQYFPYLCSVIGVQSVDVAIVNSLLTSEEFPVQCLEYWTRGELDDLPGPVLSDLFVALLQHSKDGYWICVKMLYRYLEGKDASTVTARFPVRDFVRYYTQWKGRGGYGQTMDDYYFDGVMGRILDRGPVDPDARSAVLAVATAFVQSHGPNLDRSDRSDMMWRRGRLDSLLKRLLSEFPDIAWPLVGGAILSNETVAWRMAMTLGDATDIHRKEEPAILSLPEDTLLAWCRAHEDAAPAFACRVVPILSMPGDRERSRLLHPLMARLLDEFGAREDVQSAVIANMHHATHVGSMSTYYAAFIPAFLSLQSHPSVDIQRWATRSVRALRKAVEEEKQRDEEEMMERE